MFFGEITPQLLSLNLKANCVPTWWTGLYVLKNIINYLI